MDSILSENSDGVQECIAALEQHGFTDIVLVYSSAHLLTFRLRRDGNIIAAKMQRAPNNRGDSGAFRHEMTILMELATCGMSGVSKAVGVEQTTYGPVFLIEFNEDETNLKRRGLLDAWPRDFNLILDISIQTCQILESLHQKNIRHGNIRPEVITIQGTENTVIIHDFSHASRLATEDPYIDSSILLDSSIYYLAPEATGRMNRKVDLRADIYSLGVTMYALTTGRLPFRTNAALEVIHAHCAVSPDSPQSLCKECPTAFSDVIMKCMEKVSEDRYQTANGLRVDLEEIKRRMDLPSISDDERWRGWIIGALDYASRFYSSQKIFGRDTEIQRLTEACERVRVTGKSEIAVIRGYSGVGKSRLIAEVRHRISEKGRSDFVAMKYEQYGKRVAFSRIIEALSPLFQRSLASSTYDLAKIQRRILRSLGTETRVLADLIPDLAQILQDKMKGLPIPGELPAQAAEARLKRLLFSLFGVFGRRERPLILIFDDVQWAPSSDLQLISDLKKARDLDNIYVICGHRNNEVKSIPVLEPPGIDMFIELPPLSIEDIGGIVCDTLHEDRPKLENKQTWTQHQRDLVKFIDLIARRACGNAFFAKQVLENLYRDGKLTFDFEQGCWTWNIEEIHTLIDSPDLLNLVLLQIKTLDQRTSDAIVAAAHIGTKFDLFVLAAVIGTTQGQLASDLWAALVHGLIIPDSENYKASFALAEHANLDLNAKNDAGDVGGDKDKATVYRFVHDRIQEAAYTMVPDDGESHPRMHLQIGRALSKACEGDDALYGKYLFDICTQMNHGLSQIIQPSEREKLAVLNITAGEAALRNLAFESAEEFISIAKTLLTDTEDHWERNHELSLRIYDGWVDACSSSNKFQEAVDAATEYLDHLKDDKIARIRMIIKKTRALHGLAKLREAIEVGLEGLRLAGYDVSTAEEDQPRMKALAEDALIALKPFSDREVVERFARESGIMTDPFLLLVMNAVATVSHSVYVLMPHLGILLCNIAIDLSTKHGLSAAGAFAFTFYALLLCESKKAEHYAAADALVAMAATALDRAPASASVHASKLYVGIGVVTAWTKDLRTSASYFQTAFTYAFSAQEPEYISSATFNQIVWYLTAGESLSSIKSKFSNNIKLIQKYRNQNAGVYTACLWQVITNLSDPSVENPGTLKGEWFDEDKDLEMIVQSKSTYHMLIYHLLAIWVATVYRQPAKALKHAIEGLEIMGVAKASLYGASFVFHCVIVFLDNYESLTDEQKVRLDAMIEDDLRAWAENAYKPNFEDRYLLAKAEKARIAGNVQQALHFYDETIRSASSNEHVQVLGMANERAARLLADTFGPKAAGLYAQEAYKAYIRWGCTAKADEVAACFPTLIQKEKVETPAAPSVTPESAKLSSNSIMQSPFSTSSSGAATGGSSNHRGARVSFSSNSSSSGSSDYSLNFAAELDLKVLLQNALVITRETDSQRLIEHVTRVLLQVAGADFSAIVLDNAGQLMLEATAEVGATPVTKISKPLTECVSIVPVKALNFVARTKRSIVNDWATVKNDEYLERTNPASVLLLPLVNSDMLVGVVFLQNKRIVRAFNHKRLELLTLLASQAATALEKARMYKALQDSKENLEQTVEERTLQLKVAKEEAEAAANMKSQFMATMSHEIRTPFHAIVAFATLLLDSPLTPTQMDYAQTIRDSSQELVTIVSDILDLSKLDNDKLQLDSAPFSLRACIEGAMDMVATNANAKGLELVYFNESDEYDQIRGDLTRCRQVILNLVSNAIKFTNEGEVIISSKTTPLPSMSAGQEKAVLEVSVKDTGIGISAEQQKKLFRLFSQVDSSITRQHGGTGLGLVISLKLANKMHGDITCESAEGKGSTFKFTFIAGLDKSPEEVPKDLVGKRCLIVVRKDATRRSIQQLMTSFGFDCTGAFGDAAVLNYLDNGIQFDVAIIGANSEDETYKSTIELVRSKFGAKIPIVIMARIDSTVMSTTKDLDIKAFLMNPIKRTRLWNIVREIFPDATKKTKAVEQKLPSMSMLSITEVNEDEPRKDLKILLVEDNLINVKVALKLLQREGFDDIVVAHDGLEAVQATNVTAFDIIFMDLSMPRMDGIEATKHIRAAQLEGRPRPVICALTANAMPEGLTGFDEYLSKPIDIKALKEVLRKASWSPQCYSTAA
ncbi:Chk1 protein kinase [Saitoella coloradoensis]